MDFTIFDNLIDSVFILDETRQILYANNSAAELTGKSIKRLCRKTELVDVLSFEIEGLWVLGDGEIGKADSLPFTEVSYEAPLRQTKGKIQLSVTPIQTPEGQQQWGVILHDVTLEERLHTKYHGELESKESLIAELQAAKAQLEDYSKNLESMVKERTSQLNQANVLLQAIMDSLGQGFLVFGKNGICGDIFTGACVDILGGSPSGRNISDVLKLSGPDVEQLEMWREAVFGETLPFESLASLAPNEFLGDPSKHITLDYHPIRSGSDGQIENIVMVATDKTAEKMALESLEREQEQAAMMVKIIRSQVQFQKFLEAVPQTIERVEVLAEQEVDSFLWKEAFRVLHTLEGEAGLFSLRDLKGLSKKSQEFLEPFKWDEESKQFESLVSFRSSLNELREGFNEFVLYNQQLFSALGLGQGRAIKFSRQELVSFHDFILATTSPGKIEEEYSSRFLKMSFKSLMNRYEDLVQGISEHQEKQINPLYFRGDWKVEESEVEPLVSGLVHLFRNAVDHGIETPDERLASGKPESATIQIEFKEPRALANGVEYRMDISDDGRGIDPEVIRAKAGKVFKGETLPTEAEELIQLIFRPGFSSRDVVSEYSGRGVGLDALSDCLSQMSGSIYVESEVGKGSKFRIRFVLPNREKIQLQSA